MPQHHPALRGRRPSNHMRQVGPPDNPPHPAFPIPYIPPPKPQPHGSLSVTAIDRLEGATDVLETLLLALAEQPESIGTDEGLLVPVKVRSAVTHATWQIIAEVRAFLDLQEDGSEHSEDGSS